jgi:transposase-like protein
MRKAVAMRARERLTWREAAERAGVSPQTLMRWSRRMSEEATPQRFLAVGSLPVHGAPPLEVVLAGGRRIRVPRDFDEAVLRRLVGVLESC